MSKYFNFIKENERQIKKTLNLENLDEYKDKEVELLKKFFAKYFEKEKQIQQLLQENKIDDVILIYNQLKEEKNKRKDKNQIDYKKFEKKGKIVPNENNVNLEKELKEIRNQKLAYIKFLKITAEEFEEILREIEKNKDISKLKEIQKDFNFNKLFQEIKSQKEEYAKLLEKPEKELEEILKKIEENKDISKLKKLQNRFINLKFAKNSEQKIASKILINEYKDFIIKILEISRDEFNKEIEKIDKIENKDKREKAYDNFLLDAIKKKIEQIKTEKEEYEYCVIRIEKDLDNRLKEIEKNKDISKLKELEEKYNFYKLSQEIKAKKEEYAKLLGKTEEEFEKELEEIKKNENIKKQNDLILKYKIELNKFSELSQEIKAKKEEYAKLLGKTEEEFEKELEEIDKNKDISALKELQKDFNFYKLLQEIKTKKEEYIKVLGKTEEEFEKELEKIKEKKDISKLKELQKDFNFYKLLQKIKTKKEEYIKVLEKTKEEFEEILKEIEKNKNILELKALEREYYYKDLVEKELQYSNKDIKDKIISILIEKELIKDENNLYKEVVSTWKSTNSKQIQTIEKIIEETKSLKVVKEIYNYFEEKNIYLKDFNKIKELLIEAIWETPDYDYEIISFEASIEDFIEVIKSTKIDIKRDILQIEKNKDIFNDLNKQIDTIIRFWYSSVYKYESYFDLYLGLKDMREMISDYYIREEDELFEKLFTDKFDITNFSDEKLDAYITQLYIFTNFSKKFNEELVIKWLEDIKKNQGDYYLFLRFIISKLTKMYLIEHKKIKELLNEINDKHNKENYRYEILKENIKGLQ